MKILKTYNMLYLVSVFLVNVSLTGSDSSAQELRQRDAQKIFLRIEEGLNSSAVDKFSSYFGDKNYLSLANGTTGYFSSNQSYYVIKDFLSIYQSASFKLTNIVTETSTPFASGILKYNNKGIRGTATVYISLHLIDNQWRISQITIN